MIEFINIHDEFIGQQSCTPASQLCNFALFFFSWSFLFSKLHLGSLFNQKKLIIQF